MPICPHCEKEIEVPEIAEIDPGAKMGDSLAYWLGLEGGHKLFENYPDNFNRIMEALSVRFYDAGWRKTVG